MSVTTSQARQAARTRIEGASILDRKSSPVSFRWQNEAQDSLGSISLPDTPSPFVYCEFLIEGARVAGYGGGRGANLYRNSARLVAYVLVPKNEGLDEAESIAEQVAALFRSYQDGTITCFDATVYPGGDGVTLHPAGLSSPVGSYFFATTEVSLIFDLIG
ncbi:hypothetical protein [Bradyrhizobium elkanii]|uniref:hypothetical protein n=1 Tax=Bradyrhizobium elkanii TaxID=29448 RepID=UPI0021696878|nr:hypothetical protein [Bradyrhizobium elkanii]MCS3690947.1 hypothetical protein [Bradyrhizobium elkanii]